MGTPYHIIVDEKTLETGIVSLQDRDTSAVVRIQHFVHQSIRILLTGEKCLIHTRVIV